MQPQENLLVSAHLNQLTMKPTGRSLAWNRLAEWRGINSRLLFRLSVGSFSALLLTSLFVVVVISAGRKPKHIIVLPRILSAPSTKAYKSSLGTNIGAYNSEHALRHSNLTGSVSMSEVIAMGDMYVKNICLQNEGKFLLRLVTQQVTPQVTWLSFSQYVSNGDRACLSSWDVSRYGTDNAYVTCMFNKPEAEKPWERSSCSGGRFKLSKSSAYTGIYSCTDGFKCHRAGVVSPIIPYSPGKSYVRSVCLETQGTRKVRLHIKQKRGSQSPFDYLTNWVYLGTRSCIPSSALSLVTPFEEFECFFQSLQNPKSSKCIGTDFTFNPSSNNVGIYQCESTGGYAPVCRRVATEGPILRV